MTSSSGGSSKPRGTLLGQVIDNRFEVLRRIGQGAMGQVYLARQISLDLPRALKVIDATAGLESSMEARFRREALAMSRLQHANIAQVIDFGTFHLGPESSGYYLVMEYIEGASLEQFIDERRSLPLAEMMTVVSRIADAIAFAHGRGIVHRDLKPSNILLQDRSIAHVKVIDFGLAKLATGESQTRLTEDQQILGTPLFMSPEQCLSAEVGPPADIYALAGIAYYVLSGRPVFLEKTLTAILMAQAYHAPVALSERCPQAGVPRILDELLLSCLRKEPAERPTADEVCKHLEGISTWLASQSKPSPQVAVAAAMEPVQASNSARDREGDREGNRDRAKRDPGSIEPTLAGPRIPSDGHQSASNILERPEALASAIWQSSEPGQSQSAVLPRTRRQEGLFNQITALLLEFATELQHHLNLTASVGVIARRIDSLQQALSDLEMEAALLDSELGELEMSPSESAGTKRRRADLEFQVGELTRSQNQEYRTLYLYVVSYRKEVHDRALLAYYDELERLIREYLEEASQSQNGRVR